MGIGSRIIMVFNLCNKIPHYKGVFPISFDQLIGPIVLLSILYN